MAYNYSPFFSKISIQGKNQDELSYVFSSGPIEQKKCSVFLFGVFAISSAQEVYQQFIKQTVKNFIDFIIENNKEAVLKYINDMVSGGEDLEQFINSSIDYVRKLLFLKLSPSSEVLISGNLTKEELKKAKIQTTGLTEKKIYGIIKQLLEAVNNIKYSPMPQLPLELAVIEIIGE